MTTRRNVDNTPWSGYSFNSDPQTIEDLSSHPAWSVPGDVRLPIAKLAGKLVYLRRHTDGSWDATVEDDEEGEWPDPEHPNIDYEGGIRPLDAKPLDEWPLKVRNLSRLIRKI